MDVRVCWIPDMDYMASILNDIDLSEIEKISLVNWDSLPENPHKYQMNERQRKDKFLIVESSKAMMSV